ncbi:MAG: CDP-alcohol phosphatidyltransferase family protein [Clostridiales bacterium]|nr:CDP-alcohol phosphatidyltransferase family protein [Clostridiales bacterium]
MTDENTGRYQKKIITVPNILSLFRLCLIPVIVWLYCFRNDYLLTTLVLVISGATDVIDGIIARRFGMISDFGKAFDPVADKLTQIVTLFCLVVRFPHMIIPLVVLTVKEVLAAIFNMITIKKTGEVMGAVWHGKLNTVLLYSMMVIHLVWFRIPAVVSDILIVVCTAMMLLSAVLYNMRNARALEQHKELR